MRKIRRVLPPRLRRQRQAKWLLAGLWLVLLFCPSTRSMLLLQVRLLTGTTPPHAGYVSPWFRPGG